MLSSISSGLERWLVNHALIHLVSELKVFKNIKFLGDLTNKLQNGLFETDVYKNLELRW